MRVYRVLPDATAFNLARKRRENVLLILLSLTLLVIASGVLWYLLVQPLSQVARQMPMPGLAPAKPPVQAPPASSGARQETRLSPPPAPEQGMPQTQPGPPAAPPPPAAVREPEMIPIRGGVFMMGSNDDPSEKPARRVTIKPFAIGKYPITVREWNECAVAKACGFLAGGKDDAPVTNISWSDAKTFAGWLATATSKPYRLPSEAEWEYAARGGTQSKYWWGDQLQQGMANCKNCADVATAEQPLKVGSFKSNPFDLFDMGGSVDQWVEDCWHKSYQGAPSDGSPWLAGECSSHVIRSGSWKNDATYVRPASRDNYDTNVRYPTHGFRVALSP